MIDVRLALAFALLLISSGVAAQDTSRARGVPACEGRVIRAIEVNAKRPPFEGQSAHWRKLARAMGLHHATTDSSVVRRFLTLRVGGRCTAFRLRESERLLRAQPYLADATVRAVADDSGGVIVEAETVDEIPVIGSISFSGTRLTALKIGSENIFGRAWLVEARGSLRRLEGQAIGLHSTYYQFLHRPYVLDIAGEVGERVRSWQVATGHPYYTDLQAVAWQTGVQRTDRGFAVVKRGDDRPDLGLAYSALTADVAGVARLGTVAHPMLLGGVAVLSRRDPAGGFSVSDRGVVADTGLAGRYESVRTARLLGVGAWRNLRYITAHGFDALNGTQDVAKGLQVLGSFGHGVHVAHSASDMFAFADVYGGAGGPVKFTAVHFTAEGRRDQDLANWDGVIASGRAAFYWKQSADNLVRVWMDGAGGWKVRTPFQLVPATDETRIGGYRGSLVGARRAGGGIEARRVFRGLQKRADIGASLFVSAARLWAGDAPYGVDTPVLPNVGVGLLAGVPRGSKRMVRLDLAVPLQRSIGRAGLEVRFSFLDRTNIVRQEMGDVARSREGLVGPDVFKP